MSHPAESEITDALKTVKLPDSDTNLINAGIVSDLIVKDGHVQFALEIDPKDAQRLEPTRVEAETSVKKIKGVLSVTAVLSAHKRLPRRHKKKWKKNSYCRKWVRFWLLPLEKGAWENQRQPQISLQAFGEWVCVRPCLMQTFMVPPFPQ